MRNLIIAVALIFVVGCKPSSDRLEPIETRHLTSEDYEGFIVSPGKVTAVMFHADWCGPCKQLRPVVEEVVGEFEGKVVLGLVDVDDSSELAKSLGVTAIPDLRLFRNGVMVDAMKGVIPKEQIRNHFAIQVAQVGGSKESSAIAPMSEPVIQPLKED